MSRNPGRLVTFIDKEGVQHWGRTFNSILPVNNKIVVFYLDAGFNHVYETNKDGKKIKKKRLFDPGRLTVHGMVD